MIKQIGLPLRGRPILLITRMITDRIGLHSVLLPLQTAPSKAYSSPRRDSFQPRGSKSALGNWTVIRPKNRTVFYSTKRPPFWGQNRPFWCTVYHGKTASVNKFVFTFS